MLGGENDTRRKVVNDKKRKYGVIAQGQLDDGSDSTAPHASPSVFLRVFAHLDHCGVS